MQLDAMRIFVTKEREYPDIPKRLAEARKQCPKSVSRICGEAGISPAYWYQIVGGDAKGMPLATLQALERALGTNLGITEADLLSNDD